MTYLSRYCHLFSKNKRLKTCNTGIFFSRVRRHRESAIHTASRVYSIGLFFIFHSVYPVRDTVRVRVRVSIFGLGIASLAALRS